MLAIVDNAIRQWHVLQRSAFNDDGSLWFPARLTQQYLDDQRRTLGPYLFTSQYLNQAIAQEEQRFMPDWIVYANCSIEVVEGHIRLLSPTGRFFALNIFTAVDPAISERKQADFTGIVTLGVTQYGQWVVLSARRVRGGAHIVLDEIIREIRTWHAGAIGIETVAYQKALKEFLLDRLREEDLRVVVEELVSGSGRSKRARIEGLVPLFSSGRVLLRQGIGPELETELLVWSPNKESGHDDLIDSLSHMLTLAYPPSAKGQKATGVDRYEMNPRERTKTNMQETSAPSARQNLKTGYGGRKEGQLNGYGSSRSSSSRRGRAGEPFGLDQKRFEEQVRASARFTRYG